MCKESGVALPQLPSLVQVTHLPMETSVTQVRSDKEEGLPVLSLQQALRPTIKYMLFNDAGKSSWRWHFPQVTDDTIKIQQGLGKRS